MSSAPEPRRVGHERSAHPAAALAGAKAELDRLLGGLRVG